MSYLFDNASTEYLQVESAPVSGTPMSFGCWFNSDDITNWQGLMWIGDKDQSQNYYLLQAAGNTGGDPVALWRRVTTTDLLNTTTGYSADTWHHAFAVCTADDDADVYIDGGSVGSSSVSRVPSGWDRTAIGGERDATPSLYMSGMIAETAIWSVALTVDEIAILAAGYSPLFVRPQSLVFYTPIVRDLFDKVGGLTLSLGGSPSVADHPPIIYPSALLIPQPIVATVDVLSPYYYYNLLSV